MGRQGCSHHGLGPLVGGKAAGPGMAKIQPTLAVNGDRIEPGSSGCALRSTGAVCFRPRLDVGEAMAHSREATEDLAGRGAMGTGRIRGKGGGGRRRL